MKFAAIALVATVSAISIRTEAEAEGKKCVGWKESVAIFDKIDTNHNGQVGRHELVHAIKEFSKSKNYTPSKEDWEWVEKTATKNAGKDHTLNKKEFHKWVNHFAKHFHVDGCK